MADPVTAILLAVGTSAATAATVGTVITVASTAFTLYSAFQTTKLPDGPRLGDLSVQTSTYGTAIPKVYGTDVVKGNIIWLRDNKIQENFKTVRPSKKTKQKIPIYSATYCLALGEGIVSRVDKIWVDGKVAYTKAAEGNQFKLSRSLVSKVKGKWRVVGRSYGDIQLRGDEVDEFFNDFDITLYNGDYTQEPDPVAQSFQADISPFRGVAYIFLNRINLEKYGNRIPDMTVQLFREAPVTEEVDTEEFGVDVNYLGNDQTTVSYELMNYYTNNTILPKYKQNPVVAQEFYSFQKNREVTSTFRPAGLKFADPRGIIFTASLERFGSALIVGDLSSGALGDVFRCDYKDVGVEGTIHTFQQYFIIAEYLMDVSNNNALSALNTSSPTDLTVKPLMRDPILHKVFPWDFPYGPDEQLKLATTGYKLNQRLFTIPVMNNPDLYVVFYHVSKLAPPAAYHIGLLKTVNGRCVIKRLTGLAQVILPNYDITVATPQDWVATQCGDKIFFYNSRGTVKVWSNSVTSAPTLTDYLDNNFAGFVMFDVPQTWPYVNEAQPVARIESYLTSLQTSNGYYVSKIGLSEETQITDWEYITTCNPKAVFYDDNSGRVLISNEITGTPVVSNQATFYSNQQLVSLSEDFRTVEQSFVYSLISSATIQNSGVCKFTDEKIYVFFQNRAIILNRADLSSSFVTTTISTGVLPAQLYLFQSNDRMIVAEGDYGTGRGPHTEVGYYKPTATFQPIPLRISSLIFNRKTNANLNNGVITLAEIIATEIKSTGYLTDDDIDVTDASGTFVSGITFARQGSVAANLQALAEAYFFYLYEEDYKIKVAMRVNLTPKLTITDDFLNAREVGQPGFKLKNNRPSAYRMPAIFEATHKDPALIYEVNTQSIERAGAEEPTKQNIELPMVLTALQAKNVLSKIIKQVYIQADGEWEITVPAIYSHLEAGHMIVIDSEEYGYYQLLIKSIDKGRPGIVKIVAIKEDPEIYGDVTYTIPGTVYEDEEPYKQNVSFIVIDSLPFDAYQDGIGFWLAAWNNQGRDTGYALIQSEDDFLTYESVESFSIRGGSTALFTTTVLPTTTTTGIYDKRNTLDLVELNIDNFTSVSEENAYTAFYGNENRWEIIRFTDVTDNGDRTYTIGNILRGYKGTEIFVGTHQIGDYLVIVNGAISKLNYSIDKLGNTYQYKIVVPGESDQSRWPTFSKTLTGFGREPLPVAHLIGSRNNAQDLTINWIPNVRYNIQYKDRVESPSDESLNSYTVSILGSDDSVIRSVTVANANTFIYTATMQLSDFGSLQTSIKVAITKDSDVMGTGLLLVKSL